MATSSITGGEHTPRLPSGHDMASLGPSDLSDSGSDVGMGAFDAETLAGDSDSLGTGERSSAEANSPLSGADILPDHLEGEVAADLDELEDALAIDELAEQAGWKAGSAASLEPVPDDPLLDDTPADVGDLSQEEAGDALQALSGAPPEPVGTTRRRPR